MKISLKDFQEAAVESLLEKLKRAKKGIRDQEPQAVILAAPTGSGKTVITAALIEEILTGSDRFEAEPDAVFLWLSDQPALNEQSRARILSVIGKLTGNDLIIVSSDFDSEAFHGGKVYFLNTGKLGKDKRLTGGTGDKRRYTIWETVSNTAKKLGDRFYLIIDEAHRGTRITKSDETNRLTIMQKFVLGSEGEIPPIELVLGVSATPRRFDELLRNQTGRLLRAVEVPPDEVRASGLLKDRIIVFHPNEDFPTEWTLLAAAARKWKEMRDAWRDYTESQNLPHMPPALVIQVEDSGENRASRTDLDKIIHTLETEIEGLQPGDIAHCFEHDNPLSEGGWIIPKVEAERIQENTRIKIVLFKMALTTGWDCPRAEVMMSFRAAKDDTLIAQLIGRMVRTPLARRVEGQELLNTVALYLPKYDLENVRQVIERLKNDPDNVPVTEVDDGAKMVTFRRDSAKSHAFDALASLPTYRMERVRKVSNTRRLMCLARLLTTLHGIAPDAWDEARRLVLETLNAEKQRLIDEDPDFQAKVEGCHEITLNAVTVEQGTWKELTDQPEKIKVALDGKNIEGLFNRAGQRLGEGLHEDYWQAHYDSEAPNRARLELFLLLQQQKVWNALEKACGERIEALFKQNRAAIKSLTATEQEQYNKVREVAKDPEALEFLPPSDIILAVDGAPEAGFRAFEGHLYVNEAGRFLAKLNAWETPVIEAETKRTGFIGWLRNIERKPWALAIPYERQGETRPMYPDFLIVREENGHPVVDILEPHGNHFADSHAKAKGLAQFAAKHASHFGRIELIRVMDGEIKRLDLADGTIRRSVLLVDSNQALDLLFGIHA
jgi:type III restriction enzyme